MMQIKKNEEIDKQEWAEFIEGHSEGTSFQHPDMYEFLSIQNRHKPLAIACCSEKIEGLVMAVIQGSRFFSSRAIIYGGPVVADNAQNVLELLLGEMINQLKRKVIYIEVRNFSDTGNKKAVFSRYNFQYFEHQNIVVPTRDKQELIKKINKGKIRQIKKSLENGCEIIETDNPNSMFQFYEILKRLYFEKIHKPLPEWEFFKTFNQNKKVGKVFLIKYRSDIVGGIVCPIFKNKVIYEWYVAGRTDIENIYPGVLATWAPINYALENSLECFDFMGSGKPTEDYGVRQFKSQFGGNLVNFGRYRRINNPLLFFIGKSGLKLLKFRKYFQ